MPVLYKTEFLKFPFMLFEDDFLQLDTLSLSKIIFLLNVAVGAVQSCDPYIIVTWELA